MSIQTNTVIFLMGPTASGKTDLAIKLSQQFPARLISVDSALIYKGMDIGTAKPDAETLKKYPHHLINICNPEESYSVHDFTKDAKAQIKIAFEKGETPILVGGTSFYFNALEHGLSTLPESTPESREKFNQLLQKKGVAALHHDLEKIDPKSAQRIHPNDAQRITRALESLHAKPSANLGTNKRLIFPHQKYLCKPELHARIKRRFLSMIDNGFNQVET
ncbi:MAG: tRNA (adenosine(37)-N6)-dimethylallyltransferase MiaA [Candidatus Thiodubiliella endoseptemdiera]|uniref:tRNA dimethylallyltransferase n=1 Tax=Candidatus Thiodubiliella endoseptemdiera TaxID=2738886 RepID=A0A853EZG4_9GAMM|nr:tRNA (adenosine(37)-N6)-dimethylallyltransferase MiaA [Candidatus Thiodubiliella endoseptemdiera]